MLEITVTNKPKKISTKSGNAIVVSTKANHTGAAVKSVILRSIQITSDGILMVGLTRFSEQSLNILTQLNTTNMEVTLLGAYVNFTVIGVLGSVLSLQLNFNDPSLVSNS